jgi:hypothetical protein
LIDPRTLSENLAGIKIKAAVAAIAAKLFSVPCPEVATLAPATTLPVVLATHAPRDGSVCCEGRKLGQLGELLIEWAFEQLKVAKSTNRLLTYQLGKRQEKK